MRTLVLSVSVTSITLLVVSLGAQVPSSAPNILKGRIEGTVLRSGNNEPLAGARVTLTRINAGTGNPMPVAGSSGTSVSTTSPENLTPMPFIGGAGAGRGGAQATAPPLPPPLPPQEVLPIPILTTDARGRFAFIDLDPATYRISVAANGYVQQEYGQRQFPGQGTWLNLLAGQTIQDLVVHLTQTGNVSGRIFDNSGQFAVNVPVQLIKVSYNGIGQKTFRDAGIIRTNDRGEYRIFWITPGRYLIAAGSPPGANANAVNITNSASDNYSFTFFPGVADATRAVTINIQSGGEASADFSVNRMQLYSVRGKVTDGAGGPPPSSINVSFAYQTTGGQSGAFNKGQIYDPATGNFEVLNIVPGAYVMQVAAGFVERMPIEVTTANLENLVFVLGSGASVTGRVRIDSPTQTAGVDKARVQFRALNMALVIGNQNTEPDGSFKVESITPGEYRVAVTGTPPELYVKEVRLGGFDLMNQTLHVAEGTRIAGTLDVVLSPNVSQIDGMISDDRGQPAAGIPTVLVPDRNREHAEFFRAVTTDQNGRYSIRSIPPGDYKLFAWEALESFAYFDPEVMKKFESQGKAIHVAESSKQTIDMPWIRATP